MLINSGILGSDNKFSLLSQGEIHPATLNLDECVEVKPEIVDQDNINPRDVTYILKQAGSPTQRDTLVA